jgi:hypothetical protein
MSRTPDRDYERVGNYLLDDLGDELQTSEHGIVRELGEHLDELGWVVRDTYELHWREMEISGEDIDKIRRVLSSRGDDLKRVVCIESLDKIMAELQILRKHLEGDK